jgi:Ca2+-binding EF-hand superfamily protein
MQNRIVSKFGLFDGGDKGYLTLDELQLCLFYFLGLELTHSEVEALVLRQGLTEAKSNSLTCPVVCDLLIPQLQQQTDEEQIRMMFEAFDPTSKGFITFEDFEQYVVESNMIPSHVDIQQMFKEAGAENNMVGLRHFILIMKAQTASAAR